MRSNSREAFDNNADDIQRLLEIHQIVGGSSRGRRYQLDVLNRSSVVLITAFWEAYCEDIASEALENIVAYAPDAENLAVALKREVLRELAKDKHQLAMWQLADDGWREVLSSRAQGMRERRARNMNTPKTENIDGLLRETIGLSSVSANWKWQGRSVEGARARLDHFVTLRGAIAHRGVDLSTVRKADVQSYFTLVRRLVSKTDLAVSAFSEAMTGRSLLVVADPCE